MSTRDSIANSEPPSGSSSVSNRSLRAVPGKLLGERSQGELDSYGCRKNEWVTRSFEGGHCTPAWGQVCQGDLN